MMRPLFACFALALGFPLAAEELPSGAVARFGSPNLRHGERPLALALDAAGKRLVSGGSDGLVKLWDTATGKLVGAYKVKDGYASSVAFAADGTLIAARFGDNFIHLIDAQTMKAKRTVPLPSVETVELSADGKLVAGITPQGSLHVFEVENGLERLQPMPGKAVAFTPNGARLTRAETGEVLRTVNVVGGENLGSCTHLSADGVTALAWSADGETLLSADGGSTGRIRLWRGKADKPVAEWLANGGVATFAQGHVVGLNNKSVAVWDRTGKLVRTFGTNVTALAVSGDGKVAATAGPEPRIVIWDIGAGTQRGNEPGDLGAIRELVRSVSGEIVVAAERGVATWTPGEPPKTIVDTPASSHVVFGDNVIATVADRTLAVWGDLPAKAPARTINLGPAAAVATALTQSDNHVFVGLDDKTVKQIDPANGAHVRSWATPSALPAMVATDDGRYLVGVGRDGFVRAWGLDKNPRTEPALLWSLRVSRSLRPAVAASWNSKLVAVASAVRMDVVEMNGNRLFYGERTWHDGPFQAVAFSHDGRFVAAGSQGSTGGVLVWEVATGSRIARFEGGCGSVTKLLFLPDYRLISASVDDNLLAWELAPKRKTPPTKDELRAAWDNLGDPNGEVGFANEQTLAQGNPLVVLDIVNAGIKSVDETRRQVARHAQNLGHAEFEKREAAYRVLRGTGSPAVKAVTILAETSADPEVAQRAEKLLADFAKKGIAQPRYGLYGDDLRVHRAVAVAESMVGMEGEMMLTAIGDLVLAGGEDAAKALARRNEKGKAK